MKSVSLVLTNSLAIREYTTTIDTTKVEQNPGQKTLVFHPSLLQPPDRTTDTPSPPVELRRRPKVVPTATTRANIILDPRPFTQPIPLLTQPMSSSFMTRKLSRSYQTQPPSPPFLVWRWKSSSSWNVRKHSDARNMSCFTPRPFFGPNARPQCGSLSALTVPLWLPQALFPLTMVISPFQTIERMTTHATRRAKTSEGSVAPLGLPLNPR